MKFLVTSRGAEIFAINIVRHLKAMSYGIANSLERFWAFIKYGYKR
ncbi:MAG: hypothetical protein ACTSSP_07770 [Candidatus Asgardarchaeia archaeon]